MSCILRGTLFGLIALLLVPYSTISTARAAPSLDLGNDAGSDNVTLPITLTNEQGTDIVGTSSDIEYDPNDFSVVDCILGPAGSSANKEVDCSLPSYGVLRVLVTGLTLDPIPDGIIADITFTIRENTPCDDTYFLLNTPSASDASGTPVTVTGTDGEIFVSCDVTDDDGDGIPNSSDNCINYPNGPLLGTCTIISGVNQIVSTGQVCTVDGDCDPGEFCEKVQADTYPPGGNGIGDACDCEGNFDCDLDVDGFEVTAFLADFGRGGYFSPCTGSLPCNGDFTCDGDADGADVTKFLEDFGRGSYDRPCPICDGSAWCSY